MIEEPPAGGSTGRVGADERTAATCNGLGTEAAAACRGGTDGLGSADGYVADDDVEATDIRGSAKGLSGTESPADVALAAICSAAGNGNTEAIAASIDDTASAIKSIAAITGTLVGAGEDDFVATDECGSAKGWDGTDGDVTTTWNGSGNAFADDDHSDAADTNAAEVKASDAAAAAFDGNSDADAVLGPVSTAAVDTGTFAAEATTLGSGTTELEGPAGTDKDAASTGECCIIWAREAVPACATCVVAESKEGVCISRSCTEGWAGAGLPEYPIRSFPRSAISSTVVGVASSLRITKVSVKLWSVLKEHQGSQVSLSVSMNRRETGSVLAK